MVSYRGHVRKEVFNVLQRLMASVPDATPITSNP